MRGSTVVFDFQLFSGQVVGCLATFSPADVQGYLEAAGQQHSG